MEPRVPSHTSDERSTSVRPTTALLRRRIALAIAEGRSPRAAARHLDVSVSTVYRALHDPEVRAALDRLHSERMQAILDASIEIAPDALVTLKVVMDSPIVPPAAKVAAARAALAAMANIVPMAETERRIAELERIVSSE